MDKHITFTVSVDQHSRFSLDGFVESDSVPSDDFVGEIKLQSGRYCMYLKVIGELSVMVRPLVLQEIIQTMRRVYG